VTDGHLNARLPDIELADLARPIDRALRRPRGREQRPDLTQVVIEDRLAANPARRLKQLPDPDTRKVGIVTQQPRDLRLERIKLRPAGARRYAGGASLWIARLTVSRCSPVRRLISRIDKPRTKCSRRISAHCSTSTTPVLPGSLCADEPRVQRPPDDQVAQFSTGAGGLVFTRRRQTAHKSIVRIQVDFVETIRRVAALK